MRSRTRGEKRLIAALILVTVASIGYLAGHGGASAAPVEGTAEASNSATTLDYASASGWQSVSAGPTLPGLAIVQPLVLAPGGDAAHAGLIVGQLQGGESHPLPAPLLARLAQVPNSAVVQLLNTQAFRYSRLSDPASGRSLTIYTIPDSATATTAIVCYASPGFSRYLSACEQLVASLTIATGSPQAEARAYLPLTPVPAYGAKVGAAIARVNALLLALRPAMHRGGSRGAVAVLAGRLAEKLNRVAEALAGVSPPAPAKLAQAALVGALRQAGAGYSALSAAVGGGDASGFATATTQVYAAEAAVNAALKDLALLGYG